MGEEQIITNLNWRVFSKLTVKYKTYSVITIESVVSQYRLQFSECNLSSSSTFPTLTILFMWSYQISISFIFPSYNLVIYIPHVAFVYNIFISCIARSNLVFTTVFLTVAMTADSALLLLYPKLLQLRMSVHMYVGT